MHKDYKTKQEQTSLFALHLNILTAAFTIRFYVIPLNVHKIQICLSYVSSAFGRQLS